MTSAKRLEDHLFVPGRQPPSVVGHLETPARRPGLHPKADRPVPLGVVGRVLQQVHQGLGQPLGVRPQRHATDTGHHPRPVPQDGLGFRRHAAQEIV